LLLIPAIDLKDGRCVRLRQGRMEDETIFSDDPVQMAGRWAAAGARRLHLVDLNGAFAGEPVNGQAIRAIAAAYPDLPIQVGGGIRDEATIAAYLEAGVNYCIIGTQAVQDPAFVARACRAFPATSSSAWTPGRVGSPSRAGPRSPTIGWRNWRGASRTTASPPSSIPTSAATA
jgi:phosphoribosylformimino-5-aminoimidazole carboxamide ribotide isomerase